MTNNNKIYKPLFKPLNIHPESEIEVKELNQEITNITADISVLNAKASDISNDLYMLLNSAIGRLSIISNQIELETNRIKDLNAICHKYKFQNIKIINNTNTKGNAYFISPDVFIASPTLTSTNNLQIFDVQGNGYEGNKYVYNNNIFADEHINTKNKEHIVDNKDITSYEYSKIETTNKELTKYPKELSFDSTPALCTLSLYSDSKINTIKIGASGERITLKDIKISIDGGTTFISALSEPIEFNNTEKKYTSNNYIYGYGYFSFPPTNFLKLTFENNEITNDSLAFKDIKITDDVTIEKIIELPDVKRKKIEINNITPIIANYNTAMLESEELITNPTDSISIFANEYIPEYFPDINKYIQYILTVNGEDYEIVPINSDRMGTKEIRTQTFNSPEDYLEVIPEKIKSAKLKVIVRPSPTGKDTPFVSNLRLCIGAKHE